MHEDIYYIPREIGTNHPLHFSMMGISYCDDSYEIKRVNSDVYCIEYIISGSGVVIDGNKQYIVKKGDVYFLKKEKNHHYFCAKGKEWTKIWFNIDGELVHNLTSIYGLQETVYFPQTELYNYFKKVIDSAKHGINDYNLFYNDAAIIFHHMLQIMKRNISADKPLSLAEKIKLYLQNSTDSDLSIKSLSKQFHLSPSQLTRIFNKEFHQSPYDFFLENKLEHSKALLLNSNMPIKEIALRLSFKEEHYFSTFFKSRTNQTPSEYRRNKLNQ